ncbi:MAG: lysophospholipid acyltransferase family protein, partial [Pseudomonadota bacterium]
MVDTIIYRLLRTLLLWLSWIPFHTGQFIGKMLGLAVSLVPMSRSDLTLTHIERSLGDTLDREGAERLLRKVYMHFGQMFFEVPHIVRLKAENLHRYVVFEREEVLFQAMRKEKGAFILTGHFGNWELMSIAMAIRFGKGAVVVRPMDFAPLDRLMVDLRSKYDTEIIPKQRSMRRLFSALKEKKVLGILLDQNVDWYEGVFVNFFGRPAATNKGLALMALKTGAPIIPTFSARQRDGRFRIIFEREVELIRTGDKERDVEDNTALFTRIIEGYVRKYPDQWFWFH